jgi:hypothetical protein
VTAPAIERPLTYPALPVELVVFAYQIGARVLGRPLVPGDPSPCCPAEILTSYTLPGQMFCPRCGHLSAVTS